MSKNKYRLLILLLFATGLVVFYHIIFTYMPKALVLWDEAANLFWASEFVQAVTKRDTNLLLSNLRGQNYFPPFGTLPLAIPTLLFGESVYALRAFNVVFTFLALLVLYKLVNLLINKGDKQKLAFALVGFFYILSPMVIMHASVVLKEPLGAFLTLLVTFTHIKGGRSLRPRVLVGILLVLLVFTKYNYGFYVWLALLIETVYLVALGGKRINKKEVFGHTVGLVMPVFAMAIWVWFIGGAITDVFTKQIEMTKDIGSYFDKALFYPKSLIYIYSPSVILGLLQIFGFLLAFKKFGHVKWRFMLMLVLTNFILVGLWTNNLHDRYIFTVMPLFYLTSAVALVDNWHLIKKGIRKLPAFIAPSLLLVFVVLLVKDILGLPKRVYGLGAYTLRSPVFNQVDYVDTWFNYTSDRWAYDIPDDGYSRPEDVFNFVFEHVETAKPVELIGWSNELSPRYFHYLQFHHKAYNGSVFGAEKYIVTLKFLPESKFRTRDFALTNDKEQARVLAVEKMDELTLIARKPFFDIGVEATVFASKN